MNRVEELLRSMTWDEKLAQMQIVFRPDPAELERWVRAGTGAVFWPRSAAAVNALQRVAVEQTRLGIPLLIGLDVIHGQRTMAPIPLALAASFDPAMVEGTARLAAAEAASGGVNWTFSPMIDVSRDPRWGRVTEGFGEDPHLTAVLGAAMIRGYQGDDLREPDRIAATAKHFVGYGHAEGGRDYNTADMSGHRLRNVYLESFRIAATAGVGAVMAAFNSIGGRPMHANRRLLTGVLKDEWAMTGVIVGDAGGVGNLVAHGVAADLLDAVRQSVRAGLDIEMGGSLTDGNGRALLSPQQLPEDRVDDAVRRILALKDRLGLFDRPFVSERDEITEPTSRARATVRAAAARSTVLLKNDGTLPVTPAGRILLTGPYADSTDHLGAWTQSFAAPAGTIAGELTRRYPRAHFTVAAGAGFYDDDPDDLPAVAAAAAAHDLVLVFAGEPSHLSGEAASRSDLRLPGRQEELIRTVAAAGVPFAVVLINGRPLVTSGWIDAAPAVLEAWHLGTEAPAAIVDILTGAAEPAARLPMSFPRSTGQVPIYYAHENTGRPATTGGTMRPAAADIGLEGPDNVTEKYTSKYLDLELGPQFEFGHGGGYTTFRYDNARLSAARLPLAVLGRGDHVTLSVDVTNTGGRDGDEVVQVYLRDLVSSVAQPVRRLVAFARRHVAMGETITVSFELGAEEFGFWDTEEGRARFVVEPGTFGLYVGGSLRATCELGFEVTRSDLDHGLSVPSPRSPAPGKWHRCAVRRRRRPGTAAWRTGAQLRSVQSRAGPEGLQPPGGDARRHGDRQRQLGPDRAGRGLTASGRTESATARPAPADTRPFGILIAEGDDTFLLVGQGVTVDFSWALGAVEVDHVEEGRFTGGGWIPGRVLNGTSACRSFPLMTWVPLGSACCASRPGSTVACLEQPPAIATLYPHTCDRRSKVSGSLWHGMTHTR